MQTQTLNIQASPYTIKLIKNLIESLDVSAVARIEEQDINKNNDFSSKYAFLFDGETKSFDKDKQARLKRLESFAGCLKGEGDESFYDNHRMKKYAK